MIEAARSLPGVSSVDGIAAGLHVLIRLDRGASEMALVSAARALGLDAQPLTKSCMSNPEPGLVLGFGTSTPNALQLKLGTLAQIELK